jgi:DTW domain-containing protein YfiP
MRGRTVVGPDAPPPDRLEEAFPWLEAPEHCLLLFPHEDAQPIERWRDHPQPLTLVVPDGTWSQAIRARKRLPGLDRLPCAVVPGGDRKYRLRHDPREGNLATLEAIARALGVLEGPAVQEALERIFQVMVDRSLYARGKLGRGEVTGGVPEEA